MVNVTAVNPASACRRGPGARGQPGSGTAVARSYSSLYCPREQKESKQLARHSLLTVGSDNKWNITNVLFSESGSLVKLETCEARFRNMCMRH